MSIEGIPTMDRVERFNGELPGGFGDMSTNLRHQVEVPMTVERSFWLRWLVAGGILVAVVTITVIVWTLRGRAASPPASEPDEKSATEQSAISVKTIHPRRDSSFQMTVEQPAYVDAYYQADLQARVAGPVKMLEVDIGDRVHTGDELIRIDVPDLEEDVLQKEAIVKQRQEELALSVAFEKTAQAAVEFARAIIPEKTSDVQRSEATRSFREKELRRLKGLASGNSPGVTPDVVDERTQYYEAATADVSAAQAAVQKAKAGLSEAQAKLEAAHADVNLKSALVNVAKKDLDRTKALLSFATITAPMDGVITRRNVDPGSFVQNATTGHTEPMLTVARTDIVTVFMKVPDNYAPYVTKNTEAVIEMGVLPEWKIQGKVTRFAPSLKNPEHDRTMRVEVDLFNGSPGEFDRLVARAKATHFAGLKGRSLPTFPMVNGKQSAGLDGKLLPGMFGKMRLTLQKFNNAWLVPSTALVHQGGRSYLFLVQDDKAVRVPVEVQVDDGRLAKIVLLEAKNGQVAQRDLTGTETVVASNQGELNDGQAVKATPSDW
jgi:multidrug efflux pump subunit AcrA (membrane-fusion protein)